jgi:hypothetical protein
MRTSTSRVRYASFPLLASSSASFDAPSSQSAVVEVGFHLRAQLLFSITADRRYRLFQIDGTDNPLLQTLYLPELPAPPPSSMPNLSMLSVDGCANTGRGMHMLQMCRKRNGGKVKPPKDGLHRRLFAFSALCAQV